MARPIGSSRRLQVNTEKSLDATIHRAPIFCVARKPRQDARDGEVMGASPLKAQPKGETDVNIPDLFRRPG